MEKFMGFDANDEAIELPPGFRFHPTDEELITHYLSPKVVDRSFRTKAIGEVDLQRVEPWDLPCKAKMGEKEWYFFCVKDWKYPTGMRTNRATDGGYWKATGKDKEILGDKSLVGMKKTLVFYRGRAPRGERTSWIMHEYRLEGKHSMHSLPRTATPGWVICRVFKKSSGGKKVHVSGLAGSTNCGAVSQSLMDFSSDEIHTISRGKLVDEVCSSSKNPGFSAFPSIFPDNCSKSSMFSSRIIPCSENSDRPDSVLMQDRSTERILMEDNAKTDFLQGVCSDMSCREVKFRPCESQEFPILSSLPLELEYSWNY